MVNGDPNMDQYIYYPDARSLTGITAVLLGSDGLVPPGMDERLPDDRKELFRMVRYGDVKSLIKHTRQKQDNDPDCWHVRYKHADDATGILLRLK
jgi:hypothetical protein